MTLMYWAFEEKKSLTIGPRGLKFFAAAGFMNFLSYAFAYTALSMERVSIISPLINGSSLFVPAVISVVSKRCRTTNTKKNRRSAARDLGSVLNFLGKVLGWLAVRWVDFFEAQHS